MTLFSEKKIILVVEDHALVRGAAVDVLNDHGYEVMEAACAADAMVILRDQGGGILLLFTEISLPGSNNGLVLAHYARRYWPSIGLLVTTGNPVPPSSLPEGSRFLAKAYDTAHLVMQVVGSSRVDLQACKLEYSIVSPK